MLLLALLAAALLAAPDERPSEDIIHSDLPLWGSVDKGVWPTSAADETGPGCATVMRYGDWQYRPSDPNEEPSWYRLRNYGVFHCFMLISDAHEREALKGRDPDYGFLIRIGSVQESGGTRELWAIQRGARPGSEYLLLARRKVPGILKEFEVLQTACPPGTIRERRGLDILSTRYCAVNSREEMIALAKRMSRLPPLARLTFEAEVEEEEEE